MIKRLLCFALMFLLSCMCFAVPSFAAGKKYYMVDGRVYSDGMAIISRVNVVENVAGVKSVQGDENSYVLAALDGWEETIYSCVLDINFKLSADAGGGYADHAEYVAMIPYDENIRLLYLYDGSGNICAEAYMSSGTQTEISFFNVEESDEGYNLEWDVEEIDDGGSSLEFDVMTVSSKTGDTNVLAYRTSEKSVFIPHDWLDPNDSVVFKLTSNDGRSTLTATSDEFITREGADKVIADKDEDWIDADTSYDGDLSVLDYIITAVILILPVAIIAFVIVLIVKKVKAKKQNKPG